VLMCLANPLPPGQTCVNWLQRMSDQWLWLRVRPRCAGAWLSWWWVTHPPLMCPASAQPGLLLASPPVTPSRQTLHPHLARRHRL
jgi:hypothetical protein